MKKREKETDLNVRRTVIDIGARVGALIPQSSELSGKRYVTGMWNVQQIKCTTHLDDGGQGTFVGRIVETVSIRPSEGLVGAVIGLKNSPVAARKWSPGRFPGSG